jgi:hypothetical protein
MTYLEKARELRGEPDWSPYVLCPEEYIPIEPVECINNCEACWNQEYKDGGQK